MRCKVNIVNTFKLQLQSRSRCIMQMYLKHVSNLYYRKVVKLDLTDYQYKGKIYDVNAYAEVRE